MTTVYDYLKTNPVFYLATRDENSARVRPFGFVMKRDDTIFFCTNKKKNVYRQMSKFPDIEISVAGADGTWLRLKGKVVFDESREAKVQVFAEAPYLLNLYPKGTDDETFVTFHLTEPNASLFSFTAPPKEISML